MAEDVIVYEWFANFITEKPQKRKWYVDSIVNREPYSFVKDYYSIFRTNLVGHIKKNKSLYELNKILKKLNPKKQVHYEILIKQIQNFMQGVEYTWVEPPKYVVEYSGLILKVNPEIGININGDELFIKMYFKQPPISIDKVKIMQKIMQDALKNDYPNARVAILDIRRCLLYEKSITEEIELSCDLEQEALMWQKLAEEE